MAVMVMVMVMAMVMVMVMVMVIGAVVMMVMVVTAQKAVIVAMAVIVLVETPLSVPARVAAWSAAKSLRAAGSAFLESSPDFLRSLRALRAACFFASSEHFCKRQTVSHQPRG